MSTPEKTRAVLRIGSTQDFAFVANARAWKERQGGVPEHAIDSSALGDGILGGTNSVRTEKHQCKRYEKRAESQPEYRRAGNAGRMAAGTMSLTRHCLVRLRTCTEFPMPFIVARGLRKGYARSA